MIYILISVILIVLLVTVRHYFKSYKRLKEDLQKQKTLFDAERKKISADAKKRSGAVQWGLAVENFAPFIDPFPLRPEDVTFLGKPIDFVGYKDTDSAEDCSVHFVEVKSGGSQLLKHQRNIKKAIQEGRVFWHEIRIASNKKVDC